MAEDKKAMSKNEVRYRLIEIKYKIGVLLDAGISKNVISAALKLNLTPRGKSS